MQEDKASNQVNDKSDQFNAIDTGVSSDKFLELFLAYKKLKKENGHLSDFKDRVNELLEDYTKGDDEGDGLKTLHRLLIDYDDMKTELAINGDSFTGGRIAVKDIEIPKDEE